ncbi:Haem-NO-binding [Halarsenatibacter silvermanii]|uniref:Haem-NO-binding n=1 Tax=Halarsenatibacter silvermanii TaxID=321763 RepID=A0A1G9M2S7_9FIRM|nr:Haem-NO-binding [Halarsenatibacter silvermanii]
MKGTLVKAMQEMVENEHGQNMWQRIIETSMLGDDFDVNILADVEDEKFKNLLNTTAEVLDISKKEAMDRFAHYFILEYALDTFAINMYFSQSDSAREFLLKMDDVHRRLTKNIDDASPPRFDYEKKDDGSLLMTYNSERGMFELFKSLAEAVGEYFNDDLRIREAGKNTVEIKFS